MFDLRFNKTYIIFVDIKKGTNGLPLVTERKPFETQVHLTRFYKTRRHYKTSQPNILVELSESTKMVDERWFTTFTTQP